MRIQQTQALIPLVLLVLAMVMPSVTVAERKTGIAWWNKECMADWERSSASQSCYQWQVWHDGLKDDYNICYVGANCKKAGWEEAYVKVEYRGRNVDVRRLHNCDGTLKLDSC